MHCYNAESVYKIIRERNSLRDEVTNKNIAIDRQDDTIRDLRNGVSTLRDELAHRNEVIDRLSGELDSQADRISILTRCNDNQANRIDEQKEIINGLSSVIRSYEADCRGDVLTIDKLNKELAELQKKYDDKHAAFTKLACEPVVSRYIMDDLGRVNPYDRIKELEQRNEFLAARFAAATDALNSIHDVLDQY